MKKSVLIAMCLVLVGCGIASADHLVVDQENIGNVDGWYNLSYYKFDQSFIPDLPVMSEVRIALHTPGVVATLEINIRDGTIDGTVIGTSIEHLPYDFTGMAVFKFSPPLSLTQGDTYFIDLNLISGEADIAIRWEDGGYSRGLMYIKEVTDEDKGVNTPTDYSDMIFQTGVRTNLAFDGGKEKIVKVGRM